MTREHLDYNCWCRNIFSADQELNYFHNYNQAEMKRRLMHGAEKFGTVDWRKVKYSDELNNKRLDLALEHLRTAQRAYRRGFVSEDEVQKRAADVANQAFMLADPLRIWK